MQSVVILNVVRLKVMVPNEHDELPFNLILNQGLLKGDTIDLLFDWFGLVCFAKKNNCQLP